MTTADHSPSRACYLRGCDNEACVLEGYRYRKQLALEHNRGQYRLRDSTQARVHMERLYAAGWTTAQIARKARVSHSTLSDLDAGRQKISRQTALAVLSIRIGPPVEAQPVDAVGTVRRLRALMCIGHSLPRIAPHTGMSAAKLWQLITGRFSKISPQTAESIARAYRTLSSTSGTSPKARAHARRKNWHGPLAWDDIDDPACKPEYMRRSEARASTKPKVYADPDRVAELTAQNLSAAEIALQLGCHKRTVVRIRGRVAA